MLAIALVEAEGTACTGIVFDVYKDVSIKMLSGRADQIVQK